MKKIILFMFLLVSLAILSVDKTGIPEFDSLVYSKGKTITFFDEQGNAVKTKTTTAMYERKIFEFKTDIPEPKMFIVVDYYVSNKQPALIFITSEQNVYLFETDDIVPGYVAAFYENGTLAQ